MDNKSNKKGNGCLIAIGLFLFLFICMVSCTGNSNKDTNKTSSTETTEESTLNEEESKDEDVSETTESEDNTTPVETPTTPTPEVTETPAPTSEAPATPQTQDKPNVDVTEAWTALQQFGEDEYPYGFDLHYILEKYTEEYIGDNTWMLKAGVTITNMYNAEYDATCEATVHYLGDGEFEINNFLVY